MQYVPFFIIDCIVFHCHLTSIQLTTFLVIFVTACIIALFQGYRLYFQYSHFFSLTSSLEPTILLILLLDVLLQIFNLTVYAFNILVSFLTRFFERAIWVVFFVTACNFSLFLPDCFLWVILFHFLVHLLKHAMLLFSYYCPHSYNFKIIISLK